MIFIKFIYILLIIKIVEGFTFTTCELYTSFFVVDHFEKFTVFGGTLLLHFYYIANTRYLQHVNLFVSAGLSSLPWTPGVHPDHFGNHYFIVFPSNWRWNFDLKPEKNRFLKKSFGLAAVARNTQCGVSGNSPLIFDTMFSEDSQLVEDGRMAPSSSIVSNNVTTWFRECSGRLPKLSRQCTLEKQAVSRHRLTALVHRVYDQIHFTLANNSTGSVRMNE